MKATGYGWLASLTLCGLALAAPPPGTPATGTSAAGAPAAGTPAAGTPQPPATGQGQSHTGASASGEGAPNDDFIEFLGADDVGDAAWWEFLNKSAPRRAKPPAPPPQDSKS